MWPLHEVQKPSTLAGLLLQMIHFAIRVTPHIRFSIAFMLIAEGKAEALPSGIKMKTRFPLPITGGLCYGLAPN